MAAAERNEFILIVCASVHTCKIHIRYQVWKILAHNRNSKWTYGVLTRICPDNMSLQRWTHWQSVVEGVEGGIEFKETTSTLFGSLSNLSFHFTAPVCLLSFPSFHLIVLVINLIVCFHYLFSCRISCSMHLISQSHVWVLKWWILNPPVKQLVTLFCEVLYK